MNNSRMQYFKDEDVLYLEIAAGQEAQSVEISPQITAELNEAGELIGVEILDASAFIRDFILDSVQVKLLNSPANMSTQELTQV